MDSETRQYIADLRASFEVMFNSHKELDRRIAEIERTLQNRTASLQEAHQSIQSLNQQSVVNKSKIDRLDLGLQSALTHLADHIRDFNAHAEGKGKPDWIKKMTRD